MGSFAFCRRRKNLSVFEIYSMSFEKSNGMDLIQVKYKVEEVFGKHKEHLDFMWSHHTYVKIFYYETKEVYKYYDYHDRKKRTAWYLDDSEFLNVSRITEEEILFYLKDRRQREQYMEFLPKLKVALYMKRNEVQVGNKGKERW